MTDIPDRIIQAHAKENFPRELHEEAYEIARGISEDDDWGVSEPLVYNIARALIARDKRAAEIVRARAPATQDMTSTFICDALDDAADAILRYDTPTGQEDGT